MTKKIAVIAHVRDLTNQQVGTVTLTAEFDELSVNPVLCDAVIEAINDLPRAVVANDEGASQRFELLHTCQRDCPILILGMELAATDEIVAELVKRSRVMVIGMIPLNDDNRIVQRYTGGRVPCRGMIAELDDYLRLEAEDANVLPPGDPGEKKPTNPNTQEESHE